MKNIGKNTTDTITIKILKNQEKKSNQYKGKTKDNNNKNSRLQKQTYSLNRLIRKTRLCKHWSKNTER